MARREMLYAERQGCNMVTPSENEREDFWLEVGPPSAYFGTDAYDTAKQDGDASPDGERLGFTGAEPPAGPEDLELEPWDDVPPEDR